MPRIELIPEVYYNPLDPYHHEYDNLPLKNINDRQNLINLAVDAYAADMREAAGTQGSLSNRLNQSIDENGDLRDTAIDETLHSIGAHTDGIYDSVEYVRMLKAERDKLELIADEAKDVSLQFNTISTEYLFDNGLVTFEDSDTVTWEVLGGNLIKANSAFPADAAHLHYYDLEPVHDNIGDPDYQNYKSTLMATAYIDGSLRVYINGIKLSESAEVYVPGPDGPDGTWYLTSFTSDASNGLFELNRPIDPDDVIRIDFDVSYA